MAIESLLVISQFPMLLSVFVLLELWYFIYTNLCPFLDRIPYFQRLNPCNACLRIGFHLLPLARFLAVPSDGDPAALRLPIDAEKDEDFNVDWLFKDDEINTSSSTEDGETTSSDFLTVKEGKSTSRINVYKALPFRFTSRLWGQVNSLDVPHMLRKPIYGLYARLFNCNVSEALVEDLTWYQNLSDFFRRELKPGVRPVEQTRSLVSPCDGKVLHFGKVEKGWMEQVKGVTYTLQGFLGPNIRGQPQTETANEIPEHDYQTSLSIRPGNSLYQCVIYLAPGDYHRFHSPTDWTINHRRHFPGLLFSVNPGVARWIRGLFNMNERVVLHGEWKHGFFSMTAVGATNVGSIGIYFDEDLRTNVPGRFKTGEYYDHHYNQSSNNNTKDNAPNGVQVVKGEGVGEFNLGSTIVLIFEAPNDFEFSFKSGEKIRLGQGISSL
ncbi:phosphatidylserine decarboxylase proenzyme, mitochondrial-like [Asterias amurensis]|uniref:phosphatidylserine decarboxylase proenzyme, mitochondrial-like n=1 Tax=Asterias amurensis TaxID=7602 RepID=UPI003AB77485